MGFKVGDEYRTNVLSHKPGGYTVTIVYHNGKSLDYNKIKFPQKYINAALENPEVKDAYIKY